MKDRLQQVINYYGLSVSKFSTEIGISKSTIHKILTSNTSIQSNNLQKLAEKFPDINLHWLITGRGQMLFSDYSDRKIPSIEDKSTLNTTASANADNETLKLLIESNAQLIRELTRLVEKGL